MKFFKKIHALVILLFFLVLLFVSFDKILADYMQSSIYRIQADSLNFGGVESSSTTYKLNDTLGEIATGDSNSAIYYMHAGYWQMQSSFISISSPSNLMMDSMTGLSGGSSEGLITWKVTTDNTAGYSFSIASSTTPALKSAEDSFSDYTPIGSDPDYNFTNSSTESSFGFSPEGTEVNNRFKDNGLICNTSTGETNAKCWDGLSTTPSVVAGRTTSNQPTGSDVTIRFRAESGVDHIQTSGEYNATIVVTATVL